MIKYFRRLRKSFFMDQHSSINQVFKVGRYLKYAIGEIILVIIGILIAVSINSWNEDRKTRIEEQSILKDLEQEISANLEDLKEAITGNERSFEAAVEMKKLFSDREAFNAMDHRSFYDLIRRLNYNQTYDPQNGILNSIISSGQINRISDKKLKYMLASLKELTADALENVKKIETQRDELMRNAWASTLVWEGTQIKTYDVKAMFEHSDL